ncbi:MAG: XdhC family aldehyde oxidoreductase maturation factor [Desulfobacterales bacterium]
MREITDLINREIANGSPVVCAVIVSSTGSTPRGTGSRMVICSDGTCAGSVGGGPAEAMAQKTAPGVFQKGASRILKLDLTGGQAADAGMICGGRMEILLEYIPPDGKNREFWDRVARNLAAGCSFRLITVFEHLYDPEGSGVRILARQTDENGLPGEIPAPLRSAAAENTARARKACVLEHKDLRVLIEPLPGLGRVIIAGAGHVGAAVAFIAAQVGFRTLVMDDRGDFLSPESFPAADQLLQISDFSSCLSGLYPGQDDHVVIVTRGHLHDKTVLAQALQTPAGYIGMMGSRSKRDAIFRDLLQNGFSESDLRRVHSPIGLDIGAQTPEELAVSIVAELIGHRAGRSSR